jgi:RHS repeat-associated protein
LLQNRQWTGDGRGPLARLRVSSIKTDTGAGVSVTYTNIAHTGADDQNPGTNSSCPAFVPTTPPTMPSPDHNNLLCMPQWWTPPTPTGSPAAAPLKDWFFKYVASQVTVTPGRRQAAQTTYYDYYQPAWRFEMSPLTPDDRRTWADFAGFARVDIKQGTANTPQWTSYRFFQGLDQDPQTSGSALSPRVVSLLSSVDGSTVVDSRSWAGRVFEKQITDGGISGTEISHTVTKPYALAHVDTAADYEYIDGSSTYTGTSLHTKAVRTGDYQAITKVKLSSGVTRTSTVTTHYDEDQPSTPIGRVTSVAEAPDSSQPALDRCTMTRYADNVAANMLSFSKALLVSKTCLATPTLSPSASDVISWAWTAYDNFAAGTAPSVGSPTQTWVSTNGSTPSLSTATIAYDGLGRQTSVTDQLGRVSTTAYTPPNSGLTTQTLVTNPMGWQTKSTMNPAWGAVTEVDDLNHHITSAQYDPLGRRTKVWNPDHPLSANSGSPSTTYDYAMPTETVGVGSSTTGYGTYFADNAATTLTSSANGDAAIAVTTGVLHSDGRDKSITLLDGLLRPVQVQSNSPASANAAIVTDTYYNDQGQVDWTSLPCAAAPSGGVPSLPVAQLLDPTCGDASASIKNYTAHDGVGRKLTETATLNGATQRQTTYSYSGADQVNVTPMVGGSPSTSGIPTTTYSDARGQTTSMVQSPVGGTATTTTYGYDNAGHMTSMTDAATKQWTWTFDLLGRQTASTDPDKGASSATFDTVGRMLTSTDARTTVLTYQYDNADRKTAEYAGSVSDANLRATWSYDDLGKGLASSAKRYPTGLTGPVYVTATVGYDAANRSLGTRVSIPADEGLLAGVYTSTATYNLDGTLATQSEPAAGGLQADTLGYSYSLGYLQHMDGRTPYLSGVSYTGIGHVATMTKLASSQAVVSYSYDKFGRVNDIVDNLTPAGGVPADIANHLYSYDSADNVRTIKDSVSSDLQCFSYDGMQRLTQAWTPASGANSSVAECGSAPTSGTSFATMGAMWQSYTYDNVGDRLGLVKHSTTGGSDVTDTYTYGGVGLPGHALASVSGGTSSTYAYNAIGAVSSRSVGGVTQDSSYDDEGRLSTVKVGSVVKQRSVYDADGDRLLLQDSTGTTLYLGMTELKLNTAGTGVVGTRSYSALGHQLAVRVANPAYVGPATPPFPTWLYWTSDDAQGTPRLSIRTNSTTGTGADRVTQLRDPFGNTRGAAPAGWPDSKGFLNQPVDTDTATTHLGARDYDPTLGRFLSVDPVLTPFNPQQNNGYSYGWNNPITHADPSGLEPRTPGKCFNDDATCNKTNPGGVMAPSAPGNTGSNGCGGRGCGDDPTQTPADPGSAVGQPGAGRPCPVSAVGCTDTVGVSTPLFWTDANVHLRARCALGPLNMQACFAGQDDAQEAIDGAAKLFHRANPRDNDSTPDAFTHALWAALLTLDVGPEVAMGITTKFEQHPGNDYAAAHMDTTNDIRGVQATLKFAEKYGTPVAAPRQLPGMPPHCQTCAHYVVNKPDLVKYIYQMALDGKLETLDG